MTIKHGANLFDLAKELHIEKSSIMDFSSNINPFGSSVKAKKAVAENMDAVSIYPDPDYVNLKKSISEYTEAKHSTPPPCHSFRGMGAYFPMQKWEKISPRMSSVEISPVISPR